MGAELDRHPELDAWRYWLVLGSFALVGLVIAGRLIDLQVVQRQALGERADRVQKYESKLEGRRGVIRDRHGVPLAMSAPVEVVWVVPEVLSEQVDALPVLAATAEVSFRKLKGMLRSNPKSRYLPIRTAASPAVGDAVRDLDIPGVFVDRAYRRYYPAAEVTAHLIGFASADGVGLEGMEKALNDVLRGVDGRRVVRRDAVRRVIQKLDGSVAATPGEDVRLTVDLRLQYIAYRELNQAVHDFDASGGLAVIADVESGDILAMVGQPGYNPNDGAARGKAPVMNRVVKDQFEPGSTIKPFIIARALDDRVFNPSSELKTGNGRLKIGGHQISDHSPMGTITIEALLRRSSNVGAAQVGMRLGGEKVWSQLHALGFGQPTYVGFPSESSGELAPWDLWGKTKTASSSIGYGFQVTALQMVRAYAALARDGELPSLRLMLDQETLPAERVMSAAVARQVRRMLEGVVTNEGTAPKAAVRGYRVAGKTGTVRKIVDRAYSDKHHNALFVGMLPADNPRIVGMVLIDNPGGEKHYGGRIAGPVFSRIMSRAAQLLQIPPDNAVPVLTAISTTERAA